jgi:regulator of protease activity HflC (stomatin/prohibitin superfamily)
MRSRVKLEYANREGELIKRKAKLEAQKLIENAEIDAQITNLKAEKEVNAVEAEIKVLQEENDGSESTCCFSFCFSLR